MLPLLLTVFIDSLGFGLVFPIFSPLIINNEGGMFVGEASLAVRGLIFGLLISAYCIGQFFGGPLLGALSDRHGRRRVLISAMGLASIGYVISGMGIFFGALSVLFLGRLLAGLSAGSFPVAQSAVADGSRGEEKGKKMGLIGTAFWVGFVVGPFVGGHLAAYGFLTPFLVAGGICLLNVLLLTTFFRESILEKRVAQISLLSGLRLLRRAFSTVGLRGIFLVMFIFCLGWGFFTEFSPVYLVQKYRFSVREIANFYAWVGLWIAIAQGLIIRPLLKYFSPEKLLLLGLLFLGLVLPTLLLAQKGSHLIWMVPLIAIPQAMIFPTSATIVSNRVAGRSQGEVLGINNSVQWAAIAIPPLFSGSLVALMPHLPIAVGSCCMLSAFFICLFVVVGKESP